MQRQQIWLHILVLGIYTLLALLLTWPLVTHFTTHVPGDGIDDPALAWNLWWIKERLVDQRNLDIFHADWMFFPIEINLGFYTLTPLNGLLSLPLQGAFSLITATNLLLLSSYVLAGYGTFLLVRYLVADGGQQTADSRRQPADGGQQTADGGQQTADGGRQTADGGQQTADESSPLRIFASSPPRLVASAHPRIRASAHRLLPALFAGVIYAFASSKLFYAGLGQFNIASSQWIPFTVLYVLRAGDSLRWRDAGLAALFLALQAWAELTYASFLLIFIALYLLWRLATHQGGWLPRLQLLPRFIFMGIAFAVAISPFLWAMAPDLLREGDFFARGGGFADLFSADLAGYLLPTQLHPLLGHYVAALPFPSDKGQQIFTGYSALLIALAGTVWLIRRQGWRGLFWPLMTFGFWWLSLGGEVRWLGQSTGIPGPFDLVSQLPFFSGNRYPSRYGVMLMLCVAVLAGYGLAWLMKSAGRAVPGIRGRLPILTLQSSLSVALIALFLFEHLSVPLPLNDFRTPAIYQRIAAEPGDFTLLELPTGWRNGARVMGRSDILIMMQQWYQTVHGKRRLGGNTSRNPAYKFQYFTDAPLLGDLIMLMNADAEIDGRPYLAAALESDWQVLIERNQAAAPFVLDFLNVRYVLLHPERSPPALIRFVEEALPVSLVEEWQGVDWQNQLASIRLYQVNIVNGPSQSEWALDLGSELGRLFLAEGWSLRGVQGEDHDEIRYATRTEADLLLRLPEAGGLLTFHLYGPATLQGLSLNQESLAWNVRDETSHVQVVEVQIPSGRSAGVVERLSFRFDGLIPAAETLAGAAESWPIADTGVSLPGHRPVMAVSAGKDGGDFAAIFVAGKDVAQNQLGYNLIALDQEGRLLESVVFNTLASAQESVAMAEWLSRWPSGTIIAGAVSDEASYNLQQVAVDALRQVGVETDLRGRFRGSHAFIGAVGTPGGSALESFAPFGPATVVAGPALDAPAISGGIGHIHFQPYANPSSAQSAQ
jgi:hypothetical protein